MRSDFFWINKKLEKSKQGHIYHYNTKTTQKFVLIDRSWFENILKYTISGHFLEDRIYEYINMMNLLVYQNRYNNIKNIGFFEYLENFDRNFSNIDKNDQC